MARDYRTGRFIPKHAPPQPLEPGGTPWAGGDPVRWAPPDGLTVLDAAFPKRLTLPASGFWEMAHQRPDRAALAGLAARARADEATYQETFVVAAGDTMPIPVVRAGRTTYEALYPATLAHEFTDADRERLELALGRSM